MLYLHWTVLAGVVIGPFYDLGVGQPNFYYYFFDRLINLIVNQASHKFRKKYFFFLISWYSYPILKNKRGWSHIQGDCTKQAAMDMELDQFRPSITKLHSSVNNFLIFFLA